MDNKVIIMSEVEIWKPAKGFEEGYEVSSLGRVRSLTRMINCNNRYYVHKTGVIRKPYYNKVNGYMTLFLRRDKRSVQVYVHRIVAETFLPNPDNLPEVNHKDENKTNNAVSNLEWCSRIYNKQYGTGDKRRRDSARAHKIGKCYPKYVAQYSLDGELLAIHESSEEAARAIGKPLSGGNIRICARGEKGVKKSLGYVWKYVDGPE